MSKQLPWVLVGTELLIFWMFMNVAFFFLRKNLDNL